MVYKEQATVEYKYVFGPVRSGRLGLSLGLDLLGDAVCSLDCVYCEVGRTTRLTAERAAYVPARAILEELEHWKRQAARLPDYVTLGGLGEPCLNSEMGEVIAGARRILPGTPVAVLTNSTLLTDPEVRRELALADAVLPSVDTLVEDEMRRLNRPCRGVDVGGVRRGLLAFAKEFNGSIFLEVLLVAGINDSAENLAQITDFVREIGPARVDVVTMTRPGTLATAAPVPPETLARWREALGAAEKPQKDKSVSRTGGTRHIPRDAASDPGADKAAAGREAVDAARQQVAASITRRPQTVSQLADALGLREETVRRTLDGLDAQGGLTSFTSDGETFFALREDRS
ncbi:radical SAM protein [Desulfocurvus sp. DL9XJH121]